MNEINVSVRVDIKVDVNVKTEINEIIKSECTCKMKV